METYPIPIIFKPYTVVYNKKDVHDKRFIIRFDYDKDKYICDGSTIDIIESFNYKEVTSKEDLFEGDLVRLHADPNCYSVSEFLDNNQVRIHQIHGDDYDLEVPLSHLLDENYHPFNLKK